MMPALQGMDCCQELLEMLASFLAERYPDRFQLHGAMLHNAVTGKTLNTEQPEIHPLMAASLLVQVRPDPNCMMQCPPHVYIDKI